MNFRRLRQEQVDGLQVFDLNLSYRIPAFPGGTRPAISGTKRLRHSTSQFTRRPGTGARTLPGRLQYDFFTSILARAPTPELLAFRGRSTVDRPPHIAGNLSAILPESSHERIHATPKKPGIGGISHHFPVRVL